MIEVIGQGDNGIVLQKVINTVNGELLRYQIGIPGDASAMKPCDLEEGKQAIIPTRYTVVDRNGTAVARKVTKNGKLVGYEYSITGKEGLFSPVKTLAEARKAIGK